MSKSHEVTAAEMIEFIMEQVILCASSTTNDEKHRKRLEYLPGGTGSWRVTIRNYDLNRTKIVYQSGDVHEAVEFYNFADGATHKLDWRSGEFL